MTFHRLPRSVVRLSLGVALVVSTESCAAQERGASAPDSAASAFVASFYSWYVRPRTAGGGDLNWERALAERPTSFADSLLRGLRADRAAAAREPGYIVGLDFDPLTASQDACAEYVVGTVTHDSSRARVAIVAVCNGQRAATPSLVAEVVKQRGAWQFTNFIYNDRSDLLALLEKLAADRAKPVTDSLPTA